MDQSDNGIMGGEEGPSIMFGSSSQANLGEPLGNSQQQFSIKVLGFLKIIKDV